MATPLPTADPAVGQFVGPWEVLSELGSGGMAVVFGVKHRETGARRALKLLLSHVATDEVLRRFQREFRALSQLDHPHVTRVHEAGTFGSRPYYVMEWLEGVNLLQAMERWRTMGAEERFQRVENLLLEVTGALAHIHARGLVHRDISPSNIMVLPTGESRLMDFGVVKEPGGDLTSAGELVGTVAYIAPEQFTGGAVDERADLYSLGAVLYLMLTGKRPFNARTVAGYLEKHLHSAPRPPRDLVPGVPSHLDEACLRLLAKDPGDRFASASHLQHFIRAVAPPTLDVKGPRWPPRTVGRAAELAVLRRRLSALEAGTGGFLLLEGGPGSGKSRLLDEVSAHARKRGLKVLRGACGKSGDRAFSGYREIYSALVGETEAPPPDNLARIFHPVEEQSLHPPTERYGVFASFLDMLRGPEPRLVVLDNADRMDTGSTGLTEYLVRNMLGLNQEPVLFILARTTPEGGGDPMADLLAGDATGVPAERILLGPMSRAAVEDLLLSLVPGDRKAAHLARRIHLETEGNPHFVVEMIRGLVEEKAVELDPTGHARLRPGIADVTRSGLPVPQSLRAALRERLAPLDAPARRLAMVLAVARQEVDLPLLAGVTGLSPTEMGAHLDTLVEAGVVRCRTVGSSQRYDISHTGLRDVLVEELESTERALLHRAMGLVFERLWRGRLGPVLETIAWHFEEGGVPVKAYQYLVRAGEQSLARSFAEEALFLMDRALSLEDEARHNLLLDEADRILTRLLLSRARAFTHLGLWEQADVEVHAAHRIALTLDEPRLLARSHFEMGLMHRRRTALDQAQEHFLRSRDLAEEAGDATQKLLTTNRLAGIRWARGDLDGAKGEWIQVLALGETAGDRRSLAAGYGGLGLMAICRGQSAESRRYLEQACQEYEKLGALDTLTITRVNLVELYHLTGNLRRGLQLADKTVTQAREIRHQEGMALGLRYRALVLVDIGRIAEARAHVRDAIKIFQEQGNTEEILGCLAAMARMAFYEEDIEEAATWVRQATPLLEQYDVEGIAPIIHAWEARILAHEGDREGALEALERSDRVEGRRWPLHLCRVDIIAGRALAILGMTDESAARLHAALERAEGAGYRFYVFKAHRLLAHLASPSPAGEHHQRVAASLGRSLAANLQQEDASLFLQFHELEQPTGPLLKTPA